MKQYYLAIIERGEDGKGYGVFFPDVLGCVSAGDTIAEASANASEALGLHIEGMEADGDTIPKPDWDGSVESLDEEFQGVDMAAVCPVAITLYGPPKRYNVTLPESLVNRIDSITKNRSGFLADAAADKLRAM